MLNNQKKTTKKQTIRICAQRGHKGIDMVITNTQV